MKLKYIIPSLASAALLLGACQPDEYSLGDQVITSGDLAEGIAYTIDVDQNTNTVTMKSLMTDNFTVLWNHPQGRSQSKELSIKIPFAGEYGIEFGVQTRGGIVYGDTCFFTIDNLKPELLDDPMWATISGGVNQEKTWVLDINENGECKYFLSPLYFYGTLCYWLEEHAADHGTGTDAFPTSECWDWKADWAGNGSWLFGGTGAMDYGSMTFDLKNGANVRVEHKATGRVQTGTYMLDTENHTLKLTDAEMLHDPGRQDIVTRWGDIRILSLTENTMQLGVIRDNDPSEGPCLLVYNFITADYVPESTPAETEVTEPDYNGNAGDDMTTIVTTTINWQLVANAPYDWYWFDNATGAWKSNGFAALSDYSNTTWAPVPDEAEIKQFALQMTKTKDDGGQYVLTTGKGESLEGKYTVDGAWIDFGQEITFFSSSKPSTSTEVDNSWAAEIKGQKLRIVKSETKAGITTLWMGVPTKINAKGQTTEYICIKLEQKLETGTAAVPARKVEVDNSKLLWGDLEGKGNLRLEIFNAYGSGTATNPPLNPADLYFDEKMVITFTVSGLGTLSEPATAFLMNSGTNVWSPTDAGAATCEITGDGTYTLTTEGSMAAPDPGSLVFLIDIIELAGKTSTDLNVGENGVCPNVEMSIVSILMDGSEGTEGSGTVPSKPSISVDVDNSLILYGDLEGNGNLRIEIFNAWGSGTAANPPLNVEELTFNEKMVITFTVSGLGTLSEPATAFLMNSGTNVWSPTDAGAATCEITGDGTYTLTTEGSMAAPDPSSFVFNIDIVELAGKTSTDLSVGEDGRCPNVTVEIVSIKMD